MNWLARGVKSVYYFLVGDMRILIGTLLAIVVAGASAFVSPVWAGPLFFGLLSATLVLSLRRELEP